MSVMKMPKGFFLSFQMHWRPKKTFNEKKNDLFYFFVVNVFEFDFQTV
jgi:hypothetical protein